MSSATVFSTCTTCRNRPFCSELNGFTSPTTSITKPATTASPASSGTAYSGRSTKRRRISHAAPPSSTWAIRGPRRSDIHGSRSSQRAHAATETEAASELDRRDTRALNLRRQIGDRNTSGGCIIDVVTFPSLMAPPRLMGESSLPLGSQMYFQRWRQVLASIARIDLATERYITPLYTRGLVCAGPASVARQRHTA